MANSCGWAWDTEKQRAVYYEIVGNKFGFKMISYEEAEQMQMFSVEVKYSIAGLLRADGSRSLCDDEFLADRVGMALLRRTHHQHFNTQRHCRTCCC